MRSVLHWIFSPYFRLRKYDTFCQIDHCWEASMWTKWKLGQNISLFISLAKQACEWICYVNKPVDGLRLPSARFFKMSSIFPLLPFIFQLPPTKNFLSIVLRKSAMQIAYRNRTIRQKNVERLTKVRSSQLVSWLWCEHGLRLYTSGKLYRLRSLEKGGGGGGEGGWEVRVPHSRQNGVIWALLRLTWIYELLLASKKIALQF